MSNMMMFLEEITHAFTKESDRFPYLSQPCLNFVVVGGHGKAARLLLAFELIEEQSVFLTRALRAEVVAVVDERVERKL